MLENIQALVVEDDARSLITISSLLNTLGVCFKRNTTGAGVIEQVATMQPDFVLLNTDLPEGDCITICHEIRSNSCTAHIPVIAIADAFLPGEEDRLRNSGFTGCIQKPLLRREFRGVLTQTCNFQLPACPSLRVD